MTIQFPSTYISGLGLGGACTAYDEKGNTFASCAVLINTITIGIGELSNSPVDHTYTVKVNAIKNPATSGSTGYFRVATYKGINLLDYSDMFGIVGIIAAAPAIKTAAVTCTGVCTPSTVASYDIVFTTIAIIPVNSRIIIRFPSTVTLLGPPPCASVLIPGIQCNRDSNNIVSIAKITTEIGLAKEVKITFSSVTNPAISGSVGNFDVEIVEPDANNLLQVATLLAGPTIGTGTISTVTFCPNGN
jgi:hypothetical protein